MPYPVSRGGVTFDVPSLPWRLCKELQPGLLGWVVKADVGPDGRGVLRLTPEDLGALADLVFRALAASPQGMTMTREAFDNLPFSALDLASALPPILNAIGLKFEKAGAGSDPKASTGTS